MTAKKRKAPSDKERLDWLQQNPWALEDCVDINVGKDDIGFSFHETSSVYGSIRAAIDAAMKAERRSHDL